MKLLERPRARRPLAALLGTVLAALTLALTLGTASAAAAATGTPAPEDDFTSQYSVGGVIRSDDTPLEGVEVLVEGDGFSEVGVTGADGRWSVALPEPGDYTATLQVETLPEGIAPRDPENVTRQVSIGTTNTVNVLFPTGEGTVATTTAWDTLFTRLAYGLNFGLLLAMAAIGLSLIFGTTRLNNFAHGEMLTLGAVVFYVLSTLLAWNIALALVVTLLVSAFAGYAQDAWLYKPLRRRNVGLVQLMIVTIGLSIVARYVVLFNLGGGVQNINVGTTETISIGPVTMTQASVTSMLLSVLILGLVGFFLTRTRIGKATRAVSDNSSLAAASGINVDRIIRIVWILGGTLTGLSGVFYGLFRGVSWDMGFAILLLLFASVTLGGLGSAFGALVGSLIVGVATELSTVWIPNDLRYAVALVVLILVLLFRPQGVLGRKERIG